MEKGDEGEERSRRKRESSEMEGLLQHLGNTNENKIIIASIYYILIGVSHSSKPYTYEKIEEQQDKRFA